MYINKPAETPTSAIILCPDMYGWNGGRTRNLADHFASKYLVLVPKILTPGFEHDGDGAAPTSGFNVEWISQFKWSVQKPKLDAALALCKAEGITKIGVLGLCYGGHPACWMSVENPELVTCGVVAHPSIQLENVYGGNMIELVTKLNCPFLIAPAGNDLDKFGEDTDFGNALKATAKGSECVFKPYPDMNHGWSCRGDLANPETKRDVELVVKDAEAFFAKYL